MRKIKEAIIVEGKYDKNTISQVVDAYIIETSGFGIFSNREKTELIRRLARKRGIIVFTDGDGAGLVIRNYIKGAVKDGTVKQAYIPDIYGKEKRKRTASKEGKLGVEGMKPEIIIRALENCGATFENEAQPQKAEEITKADLFEAGLSGAVGSAQRRREMMKKMELPENLSSNALLDVLNALYTREEFRSII